MLCMFIADMNVTICKYVCILFSSLTWLMQLQKILEFKKYIYGDRNVSFWVAAIQMRLVKQWRYDF